MFGDEKGGLVEDIKKYPVWVERKYDGIRLLLHKDSDAHGSVLCGSTNERPCSRIESPRSPRSCSMWLENSSHAVP